MRNETSKEIDKLISELSGVGSSQELMGVLEKINAFGEKNTPKFIRSGKYKLAQDMQKKIVASYDRASEMITSDPRFSELKIFLDFINSTANYWRKSIDSSRDKIAEGYRRKGDDLDLRDKGDYKKSIKYFKKAVKVNPEDPKSWLERGISLYNMGKFGEAIRYYEKTLEIEPSNPYALCNIGLALYSLNMYEDAVNYFKKALSIDPKFETALVGIGNAYFRLDQYDESKEAIKKALSLNDKSVDANLTMAAVLNDGFYKFEEAKEFAEKALQYDRNNVNAKANLAEILLAYKDYERSERLSEEVLEAKPDLYGYSMRLVGVCSVYFQKKTEEAAKAALDLLEYYEAIHGKKVFNWKFRGLKKTIEDKEISSNVKFVLSSFIELVENPNDLFKNSLLEMLPEKIQSSKSTTIPLLPEKIRAPLEGIWSHVFPSKKDLKPKTAKEIFVKNTSTPDPKQPGSYYWEIFLMPKDALSQVDSVTYTLHETFPDPVRPVTDRESGFKLRSKGWGEFQVKVEIYLENREKLTKYHWLELGASI